MESGLIGGGVNCILAAYQNQHNRLIQYKVGPDANSIDSCMIEGIVSNNLSRMCCGVMQNSCYRGTDIWITCVNGMTLHTIDKCLWCNIYICLVIRRRKKIRAYKAALS